MVTGTMIFFVIVSFCKVINCKCGQSSLTLYDNVFTVIHHFIYIYIETSCMPILGSLTNRGICNLEKKLSNEGKCIREK